MVLTSRFAEALAYSFALHASQRRKGSDVPYVSHLLGVAAIVLEHGASEDEAIAALLHDAIEDQGGAPLRQEICDRFGPMVAEIVDGCTDADTTPKPPWRAQGSVPGAVCPANARRSIWSVPPTSCTTCARSCTIIARSASPCGNTSTAAVTARCGITVPWSTRWRMSSITRH